MAQTTLLAAPRSRTGKGAARTLRRAGQIPAVLYGHGRPSEVLAVDAQSLTRYLASKDRSTIVEVAVAGQTPFKVILREIQRDPLRPTSVLHVDLYEVRGDEQITLEVPVRLIGVPDGVRNFGGVLDHQLRALDIRVFPADIPEHIDIDVLNLGIGQSVHVRDVEVPKVEILNDPGQTICTVVAPRLEEAPAAPSAETTAAAEPELIRKPKAEEDTETKG